jgi:hypothetical protein
MTPASTHTQIGSKPIALRFFNAFSLRRPLRADT